MNPQDVFYVGKWVQILYSSTNISKTPLKYTKATNWMGWIRTAYLLCTRITLETTALRAISGGQAAYAWPPACPPKLQ